MACTSCLEHRNTKLQESSILPIVAVIGGGALLVWLLAKKQ